MAIRLIVGLGNPGAQYTATRHNAGAWFIDYFSKQQNIIFHPQKKFRAQVGEFANTFLLKPTTYMNESGISVATFARFYKINPEEILVVHDELDFDAGVARLKKGGGHGGHNGLRDIISRLNSPDFYRLRIGISHPGHRDDVVNYVLVKPSCDEHVAIIKVIDESTRVIPDLLMGEFQKAFHTLHS